MAEWKKIKTRTIEQYEKTAIKTTWKKDLAKNNQRLKTRLLDKHSEKMEILYFIDTDYSKKIILLKEDTATW